MALSTSHPRSRTKAFRSSTAICRGPFPRRKFWIWYSRIQLITVWPVTGGTINAPTSVVVRYPDFIASLSVRTGLTYITALGIARGYNRRLMASSMENEEVFANLLKAPELASTLSENVPNGKWRNSSI